MQNSGKWAVRIIAAILVLSLIAGLAVMAFAEEEVSANYATLQEALDNDASYYQLLADVDGITIDNDILLDLNGKKASNMTVAEGVTLQLLDSANDLYDAAECGCFSGTVNGTVEQVVKHDAKNYLVIENDGVYSAHRFYAGIDRISLVPGKAALGYKAIFEADAVINAMVSEYGYAMWVNDFVAKTYTKSGAIEKSELTLRVQNILQEGNDVLSQMGATATISGQATISFNVNGQIVTVKGAVHDTTMRAAVEAVNTALGQNHSAYSKVQVQSVRDLINKFESYMNTWEQEYIFTEDKFAPIENVSATYGENLTLGQVFTAVEGMTIGENVTAAVNGEAISVEPNWADTALNLNAGEYVITITDNDRCWTATNTVTLSKADPEVPEVGTLNATYGETLAEIALGENLTWKDASQSVGDVGTKTFVAIYDLGNNYNTIEVEVTVVVEKATPVAPAVDSKTAIYGQTLSQITLPEGFTWVDGTASVGNAGTQTHKAIYNAGENYNAVEVTVTVEVAKADSTCTAPAAKELTYTGNAQALITAGTATGGKLVYKVEGGEYSESIPTATNAGTYIVYYKVEATENYNGIAEQTISVTVAQAESSVTAPAANKLTYTGNAQALITAGTATGGKLVYKVEGGEYSESIPTATNAGTYTVYYKVEATENYNGIAEQTISVTIAQAESSVTAPAAKELTYTGNAQALITAGTATGGKLVYKVEGGEYGTAIPTATAAGTYTVYYKVEATDNYNGIAEQTITVTIAKANSVITKAPAAVENLTYIEGQTQALITAGTATGGKLVYKLEGGEYGETIPTATAAGTYTVYYKVEATDNYNGIAEKSLTVTIEQATPNVSAPTGLTATEGQTLADVKLGDGFAWKNESESVGEAGTNKFIAIYTPDDAVNYKSVEVEVSVEVAAKAEPKEKFAQKMPVVDFTYRLGNGNTVALGSIFAALEGAEINSASVNATVTAVDGVGVSGTFAANTSDWTKATLKFTGTGVVKVTISAADALPCELTFEIVNANNATSAASAKTNNVVLLNDCGFSTLEVSNGYTLFGNGFTMTCTTDTPYYQLGNAYVNLTNGTLDNVKIVLPNFPAAYMYQSQMKEGADNGNGRYYSVLDGVLAMGNSKILNSYISGASSAVAIRGGNVLIDNTTIKGGSLANILISSKPSVTLKDLTLIQKPIQANVTDTSKTAMGFSVLVLADGDGSSAVITLEGVLNQYAWANKTYASYVPEGADKVVDVVMGQTKYVHNISIDEQGAADWVNLGIAYFPFDLGNSVNNPTVNDNRTNKNTVVYSTATIPTLGTNAKVYAYENTSTVAGTVVNEPEYMAPKTNAVTLPMVTYTETADGLTGENTYATEGWTFTLTADLDAMGSYTFDFSKLVATKYGKTLSYTITDADGNEVNTAGTITLSASGVHDYVLTITDNVDCNGSAVHTYRLTVTATKTSISAPEKIADPSGDMLLLVKSKDSDWTNAIPVLEGMKIKYWSTVDNAYKELSLSTLTPTSTGKQNGTNNEWTYNGADFKLTITSSVFHDSKNIYGMPVVVDNGGNKLYFTLSDSNGYVSTKTTSKSVNITYTFEDNNGGVLTYTHPWNFVRANYTDNQYSYSDFCNGTLKAASSSSCVAPETLVTLADGSQVRVDSLTGSEQLLVWNMETGKLDSAPIMFVDNDPTAEYEIVHLYFSDGTDVKVIYEHGFWDYDLNRYVYLDKDAAQYIGHTFAKQNGSELAKVQLVDVVIEKEITTAWSPVTAGHLCYFVNGMLSMPGGVGGLFNIFDVDAETMTYDWDAMARDIETYGLFTYEELNAIVPLPEEMFEAAGGAYLKVSIGKGNLTMDELIAMIQRYTVKFQ